jgi:hypothetical protein
MQISRLSSFNYTNSTCFTPPSKDGVIEATRLASPPNTQRVGNALFQGDVAVLTSEGINLSQRELHSLARRHVIEHRGLPGGDSFLFVERLLHEHITKKSPYEEDRLKCPIYILEEFLKTMLTLPEIETMKEAREDGARWVQEAFLLLKQYRPYFYRSLFRESESESESILSTSEVSESIHEGADRFLAMWPSKPTGGSPCYYKELGLQPNASQDELRTAYEAMTKKLQDLGDSQGLTRLSIVWKVLGKPTERAKYDMAKGHSS